MAHLAEVNAWITRLLAAILLLSCTLRAERISTPRLDCKVENTMGSTVLTVSAKGGESPVRFRIDWMPGTEPDQVFRSHAAKGNAIITTHRFGKTTLTRTILASKSADCLFIHIVADQPGAVSLNARFVSEVPARILNRREILLSENGIHAHAWILPFESDVHDDGKVTVSLHGEGEALIILNLTADPEAHPIPDTLKRLGEKYDPTHSPPGPHLIWEGVSGKGATRE